MIFKSSAPSNIALIKYMGKLDTANNQPTNASFSLTLDRLTSTVELESDPTLKADEWAPLTGAGLYSIELSEKGRTKFLNHLDRVRKHFGVEGFFRVRSANNFPSDAGIASSASSFAALTLAARSAMTELGSSRKVTMSDLAEISRLGSGSSCRSFFGPWVIWDKEGVRPVEATSIQIDHELIVVDAGKKTVSSSDAHKRCLTSALFQGRPERAEKRLSQLLGALRSQDWQQCFELTWSEFWDMHALFETSQPSFGYIKPGTIAVLDQVRELWATEKDGPLATLDAGANVHLLWRADQSNLKAEFKKRSGEASR